MEPQIVHDASSSPKSGKALRVGAVLLVIVLLLGGVWGFEKYGSANAVPYSDTNTPSGVLAKNNTYFVQAKAAFTAGNYQQAQQLYEQALANASDATQKALIQYNTAKMVALNGEPVQAVDMYEQIADNPAYSGADLIKAYSLMSMGELYYRSGDPAITAEIFKNAPYSALMVSGDVPLSYRHLEEYAVTFYPVGISELRIAAWYASNITDATSTPDGSATSTYPAIINNAISIADGDVTSAKASSHAALLVPYVLLCKEDLLLTMYQAHLTSAQDVERASKDAIAAFASAGMPPSDGFAQYFYAVFLSTQGASRVADLQSTLAPFYDSTAYQGSSVFGFFANGKNNNLNQKARLVTLASLDPKFKTLLMSLGWSGTDF